MRAIIFLLIVTVFCAIMADADESNLICKSETTNCEVNIFLFCILNRTNSI